MSDTPTPFVSVVIPVYNDPVRLKTCLQALEEQTYPKDAYEVVVVDNASDESIEPIVAKFTQAMAGYEPSSGAYAARNKALTLARGEVLAFIDSDCIPAQDWLERGVAKLLSVSNCGIVGGKIEFFFQDPEHPTASELYDSSQYLNQKVYIEKLNYSVTANLFTFKHVFEHVGNFDGNMESSEDKDWGMRVALSGYSLSYADDVRVAHPARPSLKQLRQKVKRASRGSEVVNQKHNLPLVNRSFLMGLIPPLLKTIRLRRTYKVTIVGQISFLLIWLVVKYTEIQERIRVRLHRSSSET